MTTTDVPARSGVQATAGWVGVNLVGFVAGGLAAGLVAQRFQAPYVGVIDAGVAVPQHALNATVALACFGAAIGICQSVFVWRRVRWPGLWALATMLGWAAAGAISGYLSALDNGSVSGLGPRQGAVFAVTVVVGTLSVGVLPAAGQAVVLRASGTRWPAWIVAHGVAVFAGVAVAFPAMLGVAHLFGMQIPSAPAWSVAGAILGPVVGAVTWPVLDRLTGRRAG